MVTFECETNEPFVKVKWMKNNAEIFSGDKYRMHSDRKVHFLSVLIINMQDDAEYSCAVADDDHIRTTARLYVEGQLTLILICCFLFHIFKVISECLWSHVLSDLSHRCTTGNC